MPLPRDIVRQIRRLQFRARRAVEGVLGGEYHSVFKGTGMVFEDVREYQPGDDIRAIDWNVTARMGNAFVKRYIEERELTVLLLLDWSASHAFGTGRRSKREVGAELAALLAFSAVSNNDKVGLIGFTDRIESFVPPRKGVRHALRIIRDALWFEPRHRGTSIDAALNLVSKVTRRRAVIFLLSDFQDDGFEKTLKKTGRQHEVIVIRLTDPREQELVPVGLVEVEDAETGKRLLLDTGSRAVREAFADATRKRGEGLRQLVRAARGDYLEVSTDGAHLDALLRFFRQRERRMRKS
jgi:uncharacterized protein (DUF58 family)